MYDVSHLAGYARLILTPRFAGLVVIIEQFRDIKIGAGAICNLFAGLLVSDLPDIKMLESVEAEGRPEKTYIDH